ncbi:hypothetical protein GCM10025771_10360 [Niveibacterium umoris]|uniref:Integrase catalytic domain-containing protein n=1 Tax=Niveibacterium umoris TaxID=1193620 RepID=A0A840BLC2_9RHOO|nr:Mu transposase C-terminal domain-containing protein [Niveibacterium umoris]MBB4013413.1 hypothetical protein [Niveibacterium umoris]
MFAIHDVFQPTTPLPKINGPVRVIETVGREKIILIEVGEAANSLPFTISYRDWLEHLKSDALRKIADPYLMIPPTPGKLPKGATERYKNILKATEIFAREPALLHTRKTLAGAIADIAKSMGLNGRTIKRWLCAWLRSGRNPGAVLRAFLDGDADRLVKPQERGKKRGVTGRVPKSASDAPAHEVMASIVKAWDLYVVKQKKKWLDAYHDMLIDIYRIPASAFSPNDSGYFLDPALIDKYRAPTWPQTRYRFRQLKKAAFQRDAELPRGNRGKATDDAIGPGFFEIDATYFQIQLVSRLTKGKLVGRPTVYLIVDIYSGAIVGYSVTLENPSWATAALALYNCFSDKGAVFERLGLPYEAKDWPCRELPNMLRADRAELVSNMGQEFPASGIRVETPPPMTPEAKGTVEGKHAEIKNPQRGRFDLPGRFAKIRKRRDPDGKKAAALDILEFERILVEIIMDINREPVEAKRIPPDALPEGAKVASRIGFYEWGLTHRAGFTRKMGSHFVYEHLLTTTRATVTSQGIHAKGEVFNCDRLRELGYLAAAIDDKVKLSVAYNPLLASEVYFYDRKGSSWTPAFNTDPEIYRLKASFAEAASYRGWQEVLTRQAAFNAHGKRRERQAFIRQTIKDAVKGKKETPIKTSAAKAGIRENRAQERANERSPGLNESLPTTLLLETVAPPAASAVADSSVKPSTADKFKQLWSKVDAISKT